MSKPKNHVEIEITLARLLVEDIAFSVGTLQGVSDIVSRIGTGAIDAEKLKDVLEQTTRRLKPTLRQLMKELVSEETQKEKE